MDKSICCIHECGKPHFAKFLCSTHYTRLRKYGTTRLLPKAPKICRMPGCEKPSRKLRWCSMHHSRIMRTGSPFDYAQAWVIGPRSECIICGDPTIEGNGFRRYCGRSCAVMGSRGVRNSTRRCSQCGETMSLTGRHDSGRLKYSSTMTCRSCTRGVNLRRYVPLLVERDGAGCGICGDLIDLSLTYPDLFSRSVDHVLPRSRGGADTMGNFQLSHLLCNIKKQNRMDAVI